MKPNLPSTLVMVSHRVGDGECSMHITGLIGDAGIDITHYRDNDISLIRECIDTCMFSGKQPERGVIKFILKSVDNYNSDGKLDRFYEVINVRVFDI